MLVGYMRVSTAEQNLALQRDALLAAGIAPEQAYGDTCSGAVTNRPGLARTLEVVRDGDALVSWKLDRIGRSLRHVVELVDGLQQRGVGLRVLTGGIDTTSSTGRLVFGIFATLAEFERDLILERTMAGLAAARARPQRWSRSTPSSGRRAIRISPGCAPKLASCASCRLCSVPSASTPLRLGSARWTPCATCGARTVAARLRPRRSASCQVAGNARSRRETAAWTAWVTACACWTPCGSAAGGATCSPHPAFATPTRALACWQDRHGSRRGRPSVASWASRPTRHPRSGAWPRGWTPLTGTRRRTCPRTPACRWTAATWSCPSSTSWRSPPASNDYNRDNYTTDSEYLGVRSDLGGGWAIDNKLYTTAYYQRDRHGMDPGGTAPNLSGTVFLGDTATSVTNDVPGFANQNDFRDYGDLLRLTKDFSFGQLRIGVWADGQNFTTNTYAVDFSRRAVAYTLAPGTSPYTALYHSTLATVQPYAEFAWTPLSNVTLDGGVKYSAVTRTLNGPVGLTGSATDDHAAYNRALPAFSANWRIRRNLSVYAQATEGYLTPQLNLFSTTSVASVQPSTTWSYQVGSVYQRSWLSLGVDLYAIDFNNVIVGNTVGTITTFANQGAASFRGVELEATARLGHGFAVYANGSLNDSAYTTNGNNLAQTPRRTAAAALLYDRGHVAREGDEVFANVIAKSVGPQYGIDTQIPGTHDQFPIKSYNQVDLNLGYVLPAYGHRVKVSMNASNLFDHRALTGFAGSSLEGEALYWTQAGRSLFFSVAGFF